MFKFALTSWKLWEKKQCFRLRVMEMSQKASCLDSIFMCSSLVLDLPAFLREKFTERLCSLWGEGLINFMENKVVRLKPYLETV